MKISDKKSLFKQKRTWIIVGAVVAVCIILFTLAWVAAANRQAGAAAQIQKWYDTAKATAKVVSSDSQASRDERLSAIKSLTVTQDDSICKSVWWGAWRDEFWPPAKAEVDECVANAALLNKVAESASVLETYLADDTKVAKTLAIIKIAKGSGDWQKTAASSVESALRDIEAMAANRNNKKLLDASKEKLEAISTKWVALGQASSKEDREAYLKAEGELAQAYADLGVIGDISDEQVKKLIEELQANTDKL